MSRGESRGESRGALRQHGFQVEQRRHVALVPGHRRELVEQYGVADSEVDLVEGTPAEVVIDVYPDDVVEARIGAALSYSALCSRSS